MEERHAQHLKNTTIESNEESSFFRKTPNQSLLDVRFQGRPLQSHLNYQLATTTFSDENSSKLPYFEKTLEDKKVNFAQKVS